MDDIGCESKMPLTFSSYAQWKYRTKMVNDFIKEKELKLEKCNNCIKNSVCKYMEEIVFMMQKNPKELVTKYCKFYKGEKNGS